MRNRTCQAACRRPEPLPQALQRQGEIPRPDSSCGELAGVGSYPEPGFVDLLDPEAPPPPLSARGFAGVLHTHENDCRTEVTSARQSFSWVWRTPAKPRALKGGGGASGSNRSTNPGSGYEPTPANSPQELSGRGISPWR